MSRKDSNLGIKSFQINKTLLSKLSDPSSIIRIVPNSAKKISSPGSNTPKTVVVRQMRNLNANAIVIPRRDQQVGQMSESNVEQHSDHQYLSQIDNASSLSEDIQNDYIGEVNDELDPLEERQSEQMFMQTTVATSKRPFECSTSTTPQKIFKSHSGNCCLCCRETLDIILQQQNEILSLLTNKSKNIKLDLLPPMPFDDLNDFLDFDESLTNENVVFQLKTKLQRLLVSTENKSVSNVMSSLMTNNLCRKISWIGIKDTISFGTTNMVGPIVELIQDHHELDIDVVQARIAEWLRRCSDRISNEIKRSKKKSKQETS